MVVPTRDKAVMPAPVKLSVAPIKLVPVTVMVMVVPGFAAMGFIELTVGGADEYTAKISCCELVDVSELKTKTPRAAIVVNRFAGIRLRNVFASTNVVGNDSPLTRTTEELLKPVPRKVMVTSAEFGVALFGEIESKVGATACDHNGQRNKTTAINIFSAIFISRANEFSREDASIHRDILYGKVAGNAKLEVHVEGRLAVMCLETRG